MMQRTDRRGVTLALVAMAIVGSSVAVSGTLTRYPVYLGQAGRYAAATLLLALLLRREASTAPRLRPAELLRLVAGIVLLGVLLVEGLGRTTALGTVFALGALAGEVLFSLLAASLLPPLGRCACRPGSAR